jgi:hypothetical protein
MTEEVNQDVGQEDQQQQDAPQYTPMEERALEMGWRPKEEFEGDEVDFIDAAEFVRRGPLFEKIETQNREIKAVKKALESFKEHYTKVQETEFNRALAQLKVSQKQALVDGDTDLFYELNEEIDSAKEKVAELKADQGKPIAEEPPLNPQFVAWKNRNPWYDAQSYMRVFADDLGTELAAKGETPDVILKKVEAAVRKEFPNKFRNPNRDTAQSVEGSSTRSTRTSNEDFELTEIERKIMNGFVRDKLMTKEQYIADLKKVKGLA